MPSRLYVFERQLLQSDWVLRWYGNTQAYNLTGWLDSPAIGVPLVNGTQVMLGVGWICDTAPDYWSYSVSSISSDSIGPWSGLRGFDHQFDGSLGDGYIPVATLQANYLYRQRLLVTRLDPP